MMFFCQISPFITIDLLHFSAFTSGAIHSQRIKIRNNTRNHVNLLLAQ